MLFQTSAGDLNVNAVLDSNGGVITLDSTGNISQTANITTDGGSFYAASTRLIMSATSEISAGTGNAILDIRGDIDLGSVVARNVAIQSLGSITDINDVTLNVTASSLQIRATGAIGADDQGNGSPNTNARAIDTRVDILATSSGLGTYIQELNSVTVGTVDAVTIDRSNFNSTRTKISLDSLSDLESLSGDISIATNFGGIEILDGKDSDGAGVSAGGSISLVSLSGTSSNFVLHTGLFAVGNVTLKSLEGAIDEGDANARVTGNRLILEAGRYAHLSDVTVRFLQASVSENAALNTVANVGQRTNSLANQAGDDFLSNLKTMQDPFSMVENPKQFLFDKYENKFALFVINNATLEIEGISSFGSSGPNVYVETIGDSEILIGGTISTFSTTSIEGGIVLVAGSKLNFDSSGQLVTSSELSQGTSIQLVRSIGTGSQYLTAQFFDGGDGIGVKDPRLITSEFVTQTLSFLAIGETTPYERFDKHVLQRVVAQFGIDSEAGFVTIVSYADGVSETFDVNGEVGLFGEKSGFDRGSIPSFPRSNPNDAAVFTRSTAFEKDFLNTNVNLPTSIVVRRSTDFFLFENTNANEGRDIVDLTFETKQLVNVFSEGGSGAFDVPKGPDGVQAPVAPPIVIQTTVQDLPVNQPIAIELPNIVGETAKVAIYRIEADWDENGNGQPDPKEVSQLLRPELKDSLGERIDSISSSLGGAPSALEREAAILKLKSNPEISVGVYAIVETSPNGEQKVLDVFPVDDLNEFENENQNRPLIQFPEETNSPTESGELPLAPLPLIETFGQKVFPELRREFFTDSNPGSNNSESMGLRFSSGMSAMFVGSLLMLRRSSSAIAQEEPSLVQEPSLGFSSRERRSRRRINQTPLKK